MKNDGFSVLVVDDSKMMRSIIKKYLQENKILEAESGESALEILKQNTPDILITDYNMPGMNGLELIAKLKAEKSARSIPIVLLTSEEDDALTKEFSRSDEFIYIKKPFTKPHLRKIIFKILNDKG